MAYVKDSYAHALEILNNKKFSSPTKQGSLFTEEKD